MFSMPLWCATKGDEFSRDELSLGELTQCLFFKLPPPWWIFYFIGLSGHITNILVFHTVGPFQVASTLGDH